MFALPLTIPEKSSKSPRHQRKLKNEVKTVERLIMEVINDQNILHKRILRLEKARGTLSLNKGPTTNRKNNNYYSSSSRTVKRDSDSDSDSDSSSARKKRNSIEEYGYGNDFRLSSLEKSMADYSNTLEAVDGKVNGLSSLRDSTTALFTVLEALETKYDGRFNEMHTNMGRIETSVNAISIMADENKEQQVRTCLNLQCFSV
jgi:hypothetical protein